MNADDLAKDPARLAALASHGIMDTPPESGFDDIVLVAAQVCATPVSMVTLVEADRQWFKARIGTTSSGTDLASSVCVHALAEPDLLIIPDLAVDPRTRNNPMVTGEPRIRFYAGAPLRDASGEVLGSLCVIDLQPRPAGLTAAQAAGLRALGRRTMAELELRRALLGRDDRIAEQTQVQAALSASSAQAVASEGHWRLLFERLGEGLLVGEAIRDGAGRMVDWRYVELNPAWSRLMGVEADVALGRTVREIFPEVADKWLAEFSPVVETGEPFSFTREFGSTGRWLEGRAFRVEAERFAVIFSEITDRVVSERRQAALLNLGDRLRDLQSVSEMARTTAEIVGQTLRASRVCLGRIDASGERIEIEPDWTREGMASLSGHRGLGDFGGIRQDVAAGRSLIVNDVRTDPRTADAPVLLSASGIAALVHMPVREREIPMRERSTAVLMVHDDTARRWTPDTIAFLRNVADRLEVGLARLRSEAQQRVLNEELSHRLKNTLAMVQAIAKQTLRGIEDREAVQAFMDRLHALATAHDVLLRQSWTGAGMGAVVHGVLATVSGFDRFDIEGPDLALDSRATLSLSLLLHELATNALKYGSLSLEGGRVSLHWRLDPGADGPELVLDWRERGGPLVRPPETSGFGSRLIGMGLVGTGQVERRYEAQGFEAEMRAPLSQVQQP